MSAPQYPQYTLYDYLPSGNGYKVRLTAKRLDIPYRLVSMDIKGNTHSCVVDGTLTSVTGRLVKLIAWFDNEYGYTSRMIDWLYYWKRFL